MMAALLAIASAGGGLDAMVNDMQTAGTGYEAASYALGLGLFAVLSLAGAAIYYWRYAEQNQGSIHGIEAGLFAMVKALAIPFVIMVAVGTFLPGLVSYATLIGANITGVTLTGPSEIFVLGIRLSAGMIKQAWAPFLAVVHATPPIGGILGPVSGAVTGLTLDGGHMVAALFSTVVAILVSLLVVIPCFAFIAAEYILAVANAVIVLSIGAYEMGWSATPGTSPSSETYYGAVKGAVGRFVTIVVVVAFIGATVGLWGTYLSSTDLSLLLVNWLKVAGGSIVCALLAAKLPAMAENALSGRPVLTASGAVGMVKSATQGAASLGRKAA